MQTIHKLLLLPSCACLVLAACQSSEPLSSRFDGMSAATTGGTPGVADFEEFEVCKHGSSASFTFTVDRRDNGPGVDSSGTFSLNDGGCVVVASAGGLGADVSVTETSAQSGFQFDHAVVTTVTGANCQNPSFSSTTQTSATVNGSMSGSAGDGVCDGTLVEFFNQPIPPPPGKTFSIGPSSMEGAILISNGDWVNGGYSFKFKNNNHGATNFTVGATVTITGPCIGGGPATDTFILTIPTVTYSVAAGNTQWLPTGDQNSVLSWQGSAIASGLCGGIGKLDARKGAVFTATVSQNPLSGSLVDFRFKYRDPAAKGKPNTNCLDISDPNRAKADVCGASWSQTVTDP